MTNTPIHRIPLEDMTEGQMINAEVGAGAVFGSIFEEMSDLVAHSQDEKALSITMDWAAQIRDRTGCAWGTAIAVASTAYFG